MCLVLPWHLCRWGMNCNFYRSDTTSKQVKTVCACCLKNTHYWFPEKLLAPTHLTLSWAQPCPAPMGKWWRHIDVHTLPPLPVVPWEVVISYGVVLPWYKENRLLHPGGDLLCEGISHHVFHVTMSHYRLVLDFLLCSAQALGTSSFLSPCVPSNRVYGLYLFLHLHSSK